MDQVVDKRIFKKRALTKVQYKIKWLDLPDAYNQWMDLKEIEDSAQDAIEEYERKKQKSILGYFLSPEQKKLGAFSFTAP